MRRLSQYAGAGTLLMGLIWFAFHPIEASRKDAAPPSHPRISAKNPTHDCSDRCNHGRAVISTRLETASAPVWREGQVGEKVELGFELAGSTKAILRHRKEHADGRVTYGLEMPDGDELFIARTDDIWEGRIIPSDSSDGWELKGDHGSVEIIERPFEHMICSSIKQGQPIAGLTIAEQEAALPPESLVVSESAVAPLLESQPGAHSVVYLDFDGETVSGTNWNGGGTIIASDSGIASSFDIENIWSAVAEDFSPFDVNVTTKRSVFDSYPVQKRMMVIFSQSSSWYTPNPGAAGVAIVGSFGGPSDSPCWVFTNNIGTGQIAIIRDTASHECGHTMGLTHDGINSSERYGGHEGVGIPSWGPIMGAPVQKALTHWSSGDYTGANNSQDDVAIIAASIKGSAGVTGYKPDDHANNTSSPSNLIITGIDGITGYPLHENKGVIESRTDIDVFSFTTTGANDIDIWVENNDFGANLDVKLRLLNSGGGQIATSNPSNFTGADLYFTSLPAGTYLLEVTSTGAGDLSTGYSDYGSLGRYKVKVAAPAPAPPEADITSPASAEVSLPAGTGLILDSYTTGSSTQWDVLASPPLGNVIFSSPNSNYTTALFSKPGIYHIQLSSDNGGPVAVDDLYVSVEGPGDPQIYSEHAPGIGLMDQMVYGPSVTLMPQIDDDDVSLTYEWDVILGAATLSNQFIENPTLNFPGSGLSKVRLIVSDGVSSTFKTANFEASFTSATFIPPNSFADVAPATPSTMISGWNDLGHTLSPDWSEGTMPFGFDTNRGGNNVFGGLLGLDIDSLLGNSDAGCLVRIPFTVTRASDVTSLKLNIAYDDGFVAFINGQPVAVDRVTGPPTPSTTADSDKPDSPAPINIPLNPADYTLVDGENILAIFAVAEASNDKNLFITASLDGIISEGSVGEDPPYVIAASAIPDPALRDPEDDADGDNRTNLEEHAAGTPLNSADPGYPMVKMVTGGSFDIVLPSQPPSDVYYCVEHCYSLQDGWTNICEKTGVNAWSGAYLPVSDAAMPENRKAFRFDMPEGNRGFVRLKMLLVTP